MCLRIVCVLLSSNVVILILQELSHSVCLTSFTYIDVCENVFIICHICLATFATFKGIIIKQNFFT